MLGLRTVLLYAFIATITHGALIISQDTLSQDAKVETRQLKKRSPDSEEQGKVVVRSVKVVSKVASHFAHTVMSSTAINRANSSKEVFFNVELPKTAFITNFSMEVDGKLYLGEVKEKTKAKKEYQAAVSKGQTAGLVKASGRKMEKFSVSVNIAANSEVIFTLTHEELLQRSHGKYELMTRVKPKQLIQNFEIIVDIYEPQGIAFLDASGTFISNDLLPLVEKTVTDTKAHITFSPTLDQQRACPGCDGTLIDGDFIVKYDVNREKGIGDVQIVNGYFVHFFAPTDLPHMPKNVVFVIDLSISMSGNKMRQTREALLTILDDLSEEDYFGIVLFATFTERMKPSLIKATKENVEEAKEYVRKIDIRGYTNINDGVQDAVKMLLEDKANNKLPERSMSMVILLTDGQPSSGETRLDKIQENARNAMNDSMTFFCLGFGYDVDYDFLNVMATQNNGLARRIYEDSDAALQLHGFYSEVASTLLSEVNMHYPENAVDSLTNHHFKQLFNGSEIVVAGRLADIELNNFLVEVSALGLEEDISYKGQANTLDWSVVFPDDKYIFGDFTERLWAYLTIQQLLSKKDSGPEHERANATARALEMSLKYNFVTPLTSMVATKPQSDEAPPDTLIADKLTEGERSHSALGQTRYTSPSYHYNPVTSVDGDPHFIINVPEQNDSLCFNIDDAPGTIFNLVKDPLPGIVVNAQTIGDKKVDPGSRINTYFGRFGILHKKLGFQLEVTTQSITVLQSGTQTSLSWSTTESFKWPSIDLQVTKDRSLTVALKDSVKFIIILHKVWEKHPYHRDYLGFYTLDSHLLSPAVHGLLGQFYNGVHFEIGELHHGDSPDKPDATMTVKGSRLSVTRGWQRDFRWDVKNGERVPCWFIHNNGTGLIEGTASDYIVSGIFKTS
ncbi:inter-alpha-trypsin inhibitor heavy chain H3-like isoform X1 [Conger conger]|uniref:inter-alpha-trypsin inhibitor heavy chain H3-like isoform X1 n=1 Tax=Conger conger TaxID=82655 RepID=UPI002A59C5C7|nr:inter-alpha-trypsin inhibitor heavy chain H3-like isoform X1 [Conger conger]